MEKASMEKGLPLDLLSLQQQQKKEASRRPWCLYLLVAALLLFGLYRFGPALVAYCQHHPHPVEPAEPGLPIDPVDVTGNDTTIQCISDHASQGPCTTSALCCKGCCSRYGYCGEGSDFCGDGCQSTCTGNPQPPGNEAVSWNTIWCGFSQSGPGEARLRQIHASLNSAVSKMGISFGESVSKVEVAAFLGQISHESDYLKAKREYCSLPEYGSTCLEDYNYGSWCPEVKPAPGKNYYGRGWIQLTWNCNYDAAGKFLNRNLLADPDQVEYSDQIAWETTFWYWVSNNIQSPARSGQFGTTTRLINPMECNGGNSGAQQSRINRYQALRNCLSLGTEGDAGKLWC